LGPSAFVVCCLYTRSDHRPQSGAVVRKAYPCYHTRNSIKPCLSGVPPRRCCSSNLRGGKSREARLKSMKVDVCCACPEVGPGPLQKATRDQTYLAHFFPGYSSLLLPVSLSSCSVMQPRCASRGNCLTFGEDISLTMVCVLLLCTKKRPETLDKLIIHQKWDRTRFQGKNGRSVGSYQQVSVPLDKVLNRNNFRCVHSASPPSRLRSASVYAASAARPRVVRATVVVDLMNPPPPPSARDRRPVADLGAATGQHSWASCPHR
jgi:hypothetical protein